MARMKETLDVEVIGHGPALVLLHGAGGSPRDNFPFIDALGGSFTVIAPALPGSQGSPLGLEPLTAPRAAAQVLATLDELQVDAFSIAAYSMGTMIAPYIAEYAPARVSSIALSAGLTHSRPSLICNLRIWATLLDQSPRAVGRYLLSTIYRPETIDDRGVSWSEATALEIGASLAPGTREHIDLVRSSDSTSALAATAQPLLVVTPQYDGLVHPSHSQDICAARPDAEQIMVPSSHALGDEASDQWLEALQEFFAAHPPA